MKLDTLTEPEFMKIFKRVAAYVNLEGATTAHEIMRRMKQSPAYRKGVYRHSRKGKLVKERGSMDTLIHVGFPQRLAREIFKAKRTSLIYLTAVWGYEKAMEIKKRLVFRRPRRRRRPWIR